MRCVKEELVFTRALSISEKYETIIYDVSGTWRYSCNILQWSKIKRKNMKIYPMETTAWSNSKGVQIA